MDTQSGLHSYIVCGADAAERERLALRIASDALGGKSYAEAGERFAHPDLHDIFPVPPESNPHSTNLEIRIAQAREVRDAAQIKPNEAARQVFIFHDTERMNTQAQNALLATIEEPPTPCIFIFLCRNERTLLQTVRSRCAVLRAGAEDAQASAQDDADARDASRLASALMLSSNAAEAAEAAAALARLKGDNAVALVDAARAACLRSAERAAAGTDECRHALDGAERAARCLDLLAANVSAAQVAAYIVSFCER